MQQQRHSNEVYIVTPEEVGQRLSTFLAHRSEISVRQAKRVLAHNLCEVNGEIERISSRKMRLGEQVTFHQHLVETIPNCPKEVEQERILFEDDHLLIYNKPAGIRTDGDGMIALVCKNYPEAELVHRLDRDTSGLLIIAKNEQAKDLMIERFRDYQVFKTYLAIVDGRIKKDRGVIENYLGRLFRIPGQSIWGEVDPNKGQWAYTSWECLKRWKDISLVRCYPKSGRTHQIRVHMKGIGHPVLGDRQYGSHRCVTRVMLHASQLKFPHPITNEELSFEVDPPKDFFMIPPPKHRSPE